jgi:hypothetical protein
MVSIGNATAAGASSSSAGNADCQFDGPVPLVDSDPRDSDPELPEDALDDLVPCEDGVLRGGLKKSSSVAMERVYPAEGGGSEGWVSSFPLLLFWVEVPLDRSARVGLSGSFSFITPPIGGADIPARWVEVDTDRRPEPIRLGRAARPANAHEGVRYAFSAAPLEMRRMAGAIPSPRDRRERMEERGWGLA